MDKRLLGLMGLMFAGPLVAQQTLYSNPYDPSGPGDCGFSSGCQIPGSQADAQLFDLSRSATLRSVSFTVSEPYKSPETSYEWAIYSDKGGLPFGAALASGFAFRPGLGESNTYSVVEDGKVKGGFGWIDTYTFATGAVALKTGDYFLALEGFGPESSYQSWLEGKNDTGAASSEYGVWSARSTDGLGGLALTVKGTYAPEIDPSSVVGALGLLAGGVAVLRGGRRRATNA